MPFGACSVYLGPLILIGADQTDAAGESTFLGALSNPAFVGIPVAVLAAALVAGGPVLGQLELTNKLEIVIGQ